MNIISSVFKACLDFLYNFTGDWGLSIVLITILVRAFLMPLSIKQRINMKNQQRLSLKLEEIKVKYKNNKEKLDKELQKFYQENSKGIVGCLVSFLQLPVVFSLYNAISGMPAQASTILIPWVQSIRCADNNFIIPLVYALTALSPNIFNYIPALKMDMKAKASKMSILVTSLISILITLKTPVGLGIYFISTSIFSFVEELFFRIYCRKKELSY